MVKKINALSYNLTTPVRFLEVVVALVIREFQHRRPKLTSGKRRKINSLIRIYLLMKASRVVLRGVGLRVLT